MRTIQLNKKYLLWMLLLCVTFSHFGSDLYAPSLPAMAKELQAPNIANTFTTYFLGMGISQFLFGPYSDRFGRRSMLLWGLIIFLAATVICIFAPSSGWLNVGRFLQGLGIGAANVLGRAIVRDAFAVNELTRTMGYISSVWSLAPLIAPVLGSYIQTWFGWRYNFVFLFLYVGLSTLLFLRYLPETLQKKDPNAIKINVMLKNYRKLFSYHSYLGNVFCVVIIIGPLLAFPAFAPFLLQDHWHLSTVDYGWLTLLVSISYMLSTFIGPRLLHILKETQLIKISLLIYFIAASLMLVFSLTSVNVTKFMVLIMFIFFSVGLVFPIFIANALLPFSEQTGSASGLIGSFSMLINAVIAMIISYMPKNTPLPLAIFLLIEVSLVGIVFFTLVMNKKTKGE